MSKNISAEHGMKIAEALEKLGAPAVFVPHSTETPSGQQVPAIENLPKQQVPATKTSSLPASINSQLSEITLQYYKPTVKKPTKKQVRNIFSLLLLGVLLAVLAWRLYPLMHYIQPRPQIHRLDFSAYRPYMEKTPVVKNVAPQDMYPAFIHQYRLRPDRRFIDAFGILARDFGEYMGNSKGHNAYKIGKVLCNAQAFHVPLVKGNNVIAEINIPLPTTFENNVVAFNELLNIMNEGNAYPKNAESKNDILKDLKNAESYINMVDPRAIIDGLEQLEALWRKAGPDPTILKASVRGYALLHMALSPDKMDYRDTLAAHALSFLALAKWMDPGLCLVNEEALLAMNMGYTAHADALLRSRHAESIDPVNKIFNAYIRQDLQGLLRLKGEVPEILRTYIFGRLCREMKLFKQAEKVVTALYEQCPALYPFVVEAILSGNPSKAEVLTLFYPMEILACLEEKVSQSDLVDGNTWKERMMGFAGEKSESNISICQFENLLDKWRPLGPDGVQGFIIDEKRAKTVFKNLYTDALYLRFNVLFERWAAVDKAKNYAELLASQDKDHPLVMEMLANVYAELGKHEEAKNISVQLINHPDSSGRLALSAFFNVNDPKEQIRLTPEVAHRMDGRPEYLLSTGVLYEKQWNYDLAERYYSLSLDLNPFRYKGYQYLAQIKGSTEPLVTACKKFPDSFNLLEIAGDYFKAKDDDMSKEKALDYYEQALRLMPANDYIPEKKAEVLRELNRHDEAVDVLKRWIQTYDQNDLLMVSYKSNLAKTYLEMGEPRLALEAVSDQIDSFQVGAMMIGARTIERMGDIEQAAEIYRAALARYPTVDYVLSGAAAFFWDQGKNKEAAQIIALGRTCMGESSRWYFKDFIEIFAKAPNEKIIEAIDSLIEQGASVWEVNNLGLLFHRVERSEAAFQIIRKTPAGQKLEQLEKYMALYKVLREWKGEEKAMEFLNQAITTPQMQSQMIFILYNEGMFDVVLAVLNDPESYPRSERDFMWLQKLIAWLALEKNPANLEKEMIEHYKFEWYKRFIPYKFKWCERFIPESFKKKPHGYYHDVGRYLLGMITREELLDMAKTSKQRCNFAYYIGLSERLNGNFKEAANWYHLCRETLMSQNGEYLWASSELYWWAHMGTENRHRLPGDDIRAYETRQMSKIQIETGTSRQERKSAKVKKSGVYI